MTIDELQCALKGIFGRTCSKVAFTAFLGSRDDVKSELQSLIDSEPWFGDLYRCGYCVFKGILKKVCCPVCGREIPAKAASKGRVYCSVKCSNNSPETKRKKITTTRSRFGTDYATQSRAGKEKLLRTNMERYGHASPLQDEGIRKKAEKTNLERYGSVHPMELSEYREKIGFKSPFADEKVREKARRTNLERYGSECALLNDKVRERAKATNLERYGSECGFGSKVVQDKTRKTNLERYGVENVLQSQEVKERIHENNLRNYGVSENISRPDVKKRMRVAMIEKYGAENPMRNEGLREKASRTRLANAYDRMAGKWKDYVAPLFSKEEYIGFSGNAFGTTYKWKCVKCGNEFEQHVHTTGSIFEYMPRCWKCYPNMNEQGQSYKEKEVLDFVKLVYGGDIRSNEHDVINGELDIYIPDRKLAIEFDGLYWHSEEKGKDERYHLDKTRKCLEKGIRLIHIFEDEWNEKQEIVKDRIRSALGLYDRRIYARKCVLKEIDAKACSNFLEINHLQGSDHSSIRYGLFYEDELVSVMTFGKPRFNKNYDYELIRFASKLGVQIIGGASKLLAHFRKCHSGSIVSYADRRYSDGRLYEAIGFEKKEESAPNYWWTKGQVKLSRYQCQKHRLHKILENDFNPDLSESENMILNGWNRIYDCGNIVYSKKTGD